MTNENYLKVAVAAAKTSGPLFVKYFGDARDIQMKNGDPANLVTEIDKAIENKIRKLISVNFPKHKIIGEEYTRDVVGPKDLVWIIDPIDGTTNYIHGLPLCCISIALWDARGPVAAVVYNPILKQLFSAARGRGAKLNSKPITVSKIKKLNHALGGIGWLKVEKGLGIFSIMAKACRKLRVFASGAMQICFVASGKYDFYATGHINICDFAAGVLIASEAGATVTDVRGKKITLETKTIITSNGNIHDELVNKLKKL